MHFCGFTQPKGEGSEQDVFADPFLSLLTSEERIKLNNEKNFKTVFSFDEIRENLIIHIIHPRTNSGLVSLAKFIIDPLFYLALNGGLKLARILSADSQGKIIWNIESPKLSAGHAGRLS